MKIISWLWRLVAITLCALFLGIFYLAHNKSIHRWIEHQIVTGFKRAFECDFSAQVTSIDILYPIIYLNDVKAQAYDHSWSWRAQQVKVICSWWSLFYHHIVYFKLLLHQVMTTSETTNNIPAIVYHLKKLISNKPSLPLSLTQLMIQQGKLQLHDHYQQLNLTTRFDCESISYDQLCKTIWYFSDGILYRQDKVTVQDLQLNIQALISSAQARLLKLNIQSAADLSKIYMPYNKVQAELSWDNDQGVIQLKTPDEASCIEVNINQSQKNYIFSTNITLPAAFIRTLYTNYYGKKYGTNLIEGTISGTLNGNYGTSWYSNIELDFINTNKNIPINNIHLKSTLNALSSVGIAHINSSYQQQACPLCFTWHYDLNKKNGTTTITNEGKIVLPYLQEGYIEPHGLELKSSLQEDTIKGNYSAQINYQQHIFPLQGTFLYENNLLQCITHYDNHILFTDFQLVPFWLLHCHGVDKTQHTLVNLDGNAAEHSLVGSISYQMINKLLYHYTHYELPGNADGKLHLRLKNDHTIETYIKLSNGTIRLGKMFNVIRNLQTEISFDWISRTIVARNTRIQADKGFLTSTCIKMVFDQNWQLSSVHAPCTLHKVFLNQQKDLFVTMSGWLIAQYQKNLLPLVQGNIVIERGQLKKNIFSPSLQHDIGLRDKILEFPLDFNNNISLITKNPLHIKTAFLETQAMMNMNLKGTFHNPEISGSIQLRSGSLAFPYKPLTIMSGKLDFLPHQLTDPLIELTAKNRIRKYHVTLRLDGSLQQPHLSFESAPPLTEEQIITLLISGNEDGSLSLLMPSLVMYHIKNIMFESNQTPSALSMYFKNLLAPLKHIRIVPSFADITGRGGFRGSIVVDVNDQLHGLIQKNFSLPEDTRFEVDYMISDDVSIRGIKDERGDLGGEFEVRWKF